MKLYYTTTPRQIYSRDKYDRSPVTIKASTRHIGMYYWCNYWRHWDKVLRVDVDGYQVEVVKCDESGNPIDTPRLHCTGMDPAMFADKPFSITRD